MAHSFYKYHGTGNDFILIDNRNGAIMPAAKQIALLCHRRYGIGADGLMLLEKAEGYDFRMVYFNADGRESTMCGNGGRCIAAFAKKLGIINNSASFIAIDGAHTATIDGDNISLRMQDVAEIIYRDNVAILDTGSPHIVIGVENINTVNVFAEGRNIRNLEEFKPDGINVNFVQQQDNAISVRTYERGVEDETLSCGTGVTAAAITATTDNLGDFNIKVYTPGGQLNVSFTKDAATSAKNITLSGPAVFVFTGKVEL